MSGSGPGRLLRSTRAARTRVAAFAMAALLLLYLCFAIGYAVLLISIGQPVTVGLGIALLVLPLIGIWALVAELRFGIRSERLGTHLESEGGLPADPVAVLPSGRFDPASAAAVFPRYRAEVEASPEDWRAWYRLALAYAAAGDRRRARWATRRAIGLERG